MTTTKTTKTNRAARTKAYDNAWLKEQRLAGRSYRDIAREMSRDQSTVRVRLQRMLLAELMAGVTPMAVGSTSRLAASDAAADVAADVAAAAVAATGAAVPSAAGDIEPATPAAAENAGDPVDDVTPSVLPTAASGNAVTARKPAGRPRRHPELYDRAWLHNLTVVRRMDPGEIAAYYNIDTHYVLKRLRTAGLPCGVAGDRCHPDLRDAAVMRRLYIDCGMTLAQLACRYGVSEPSVSLRLGRLGLLSLRTTSVEPTPVPDRELDMHDVPRIRRLYLVKKKSRTAIAAMYGVRSGVIHLFLERFGVRRVKRGSIPGSSPAAAGRVRRRS